MVDLSTEQSNILRPNIQLVEACPGAGKTKAVIERFKQSSKAHERRGVALLSFTNIASDTALSRCLDEPSLFKPPHFIGTLDTFVHRYIVTPAITSTLGKTPTYLSSWRDFPYDIQHVLHDARYQGQGFSIDNFTISPDGIISLNEAGLRGREKRYLDQIKTNNRSHYDDLISRCISKIKQHNDRGIFDSDTARHKALLILESDEIASKIALRFSEIIVDEFQDCSAMEHAILVKLRNAGIRVLAVADPDQAIFEFRNASPQAYQDFRATLDQGEIIRFKDNYRSSQPICDLVSSLRPSTDIRIESKLSIKDRANCAPSVYILSAARREDARHKAIALMQEHGLAESDLMVLGRAKSDAKSLAGDRSSKVQSIKLVVRILMVLYVIKDGSIDSREKMKLLRSAERTLLELFRWPADVDTNSTEAMYEAIGKSPLWTRRIVSRVGQAKDALWSSRVECQQIVRDILTEECASIDIPFVSSINMRTPFTKEDWDKCREHFNETVGSNALKWSSIHGAKGAEYPGVLIYAPADDALESWSNSTNTEERRILYVAASRAQNILMIHIQQARETQIKSAFVESGLPYELIRC